MFVGLPANCIGKRDRWDFAYFLGRFLGHNDELITWVLLVETVEIYGLNECSENTWELGHLVGSMNGNIAHSN